MLKIFGDTDGFGFVAFALYLFWRSIIDHEIGDDVAQYQRLRLVQTFVAIVAFQHKEGFRFRESVLPTGKHLQYIPEFEEIVVDKRLCYDLIIFVYGVAVGAIVSIAVDVPPIFLCAFFQVAMSIDGKIRALAIFVDFFDSDCT